MAGTSFIFEAGDLDKVQSLFVDLQKLNLDTQPVMQAIAKAGEDKSIERFRLQKGPDGKAWVPSAAAKRENRKTLIKTGHFMLNTFSSEATADTSTWGTNAVQGRIFQLGGTIQMPARQGKVRLRLKANGTLERQDNYPKLARFAGARHKRAKTVDFTSKPYTIKVIARPFLGVDADDRRTFTDLMVDHYSRVARPSAGGN